MATAVTAPGPFRVVELSTVTDENLEAALNEWAERGHVLEGIHFAMRESSRRPAMAFLVFRVPATRPAASTDDEGAAGRPDSRAGSATT